jgi:hypothetical protein
MSINKWLELACGAAEHRVRMAVWTKREETASNATVLTGYAYDSQVRAGLGVLQVEVEELLRDASRLPRLSVGNRYYIADHMTKFIENAYQNVLAGALPSAGKGVASNLAQQYEQLKLGILGSVVLWGEIESQRRADQVWAVIWDVVRMTLSAALGALATLLVTQVL